MKISTAVLSILLACSCSASDRPDDPGQTFSRAALQPGDLEIAGQVLPAASGDVIVDDAGQLRRLVVDFVGGGSLRLGLEPVDGETDLVLTAQATAGGSWITVRFAAHVELELAGRCAIVDLFADRPSIDASLMFCE